MLQHTLLRNTFDRMNMVTWNILEQLCLPGRKRSKAIARPPALKPQHSLAGVCVNSCGSNDADSMRIAQTQWMLHGKASDWKVVIKAVRQFFQLAALLV